MKWLRKLARKRWVRIVVMLLAKRYRSVELFLIYFRFVFGRVGQATRREACRRLHYKNGHKWVPTSTLERGNTRIYARCRCGAIR
jgi:hypothetical protein